jgi:hypothetical protein
VGVDVGMFVAANKAVLAGAWNRTHVSLRANGRGMNRDYSGGRNGHDCPPVAV